MKQNFNECIKEILTHEGGYVWDKYDPGGETNFGVTAAVYNDYRKDKGAEIRSVRHITMQEVGEIYKKRYWDAIKGDELPSGIDLAVFDFAVNSGVSRASVALQRAIGVPADGKIGRISVGKAMVADPLATIRIICSRRMQFLHNLKNWKRYGRGWSRRVDAVEKKSILLAKQKGLIE